jgi:hypothetical protein
MLVGVEASENNDEQETEMGNEGCISFYSKDALKLNLLLYQTLEPDLI